MCFNVAICSAVSKAGLNSGFGIIVILPCILQGLLLWLFKGVSKVSSGTVQWYRSSYGTDFDNAEVASPVLHWLLGVRAQSLSLSPQGSKASLD